MSAASTREKILVAARTLLVRGGAANLTLRRIASAAGIALGNLQYHFATLDHVLEALLAHELKAGKERIERSLGGAADTPLSEIVDLLLDDHDDEPLVHLFIAVWSLAAITPQLRPLLHDFYDEWANLLAAVLTRRGMLRREAQWRARLSIACLEGLALFRSGVAGPRQEPSRRRARELLVRILQGG